MIFPRPATLKKYRLSREQYKKMFDSRQGACHICARGVRLYIDHDHKTGFVRGLLCFTCNYRVVSRGLDNERIHRFAADYMHNALRRNWQFA